MFVVYVQYTPKLYITRILWYTDILLKVVLVYSFSPSNSRVFDDNLQFVPFFGLIITELYPILYIYCTGIYSK